MRISTKSRYAIASMIYLAQQSNTGNQTTVKSLSEKLKISKIYLEQVFVLLKKVSIVVSTKGKQGGYQLLKPPKNITLFDILSAIEVGLFEKTHPTVLKGNKSIEFAMQSIVFDKLDSAISNILSSITLEELVFETEKNSVEDGYMFYL
ncbi:MAG: Rrf2 family transcriptional regulator [Elusimicrobiota bacterium]|jgi:Rrf2 family protein|nr:Rrf2 family transcriptional regulator [Elusimicrobiota bacterium]